MKYWKVINPKSQYNGFIFRESWVWPDGSVTLSVNGIGLLFKSNEVEVSEAA